LFHPDLAPDGGDAPLEYSTAAAQYGSKVAGLRLLPPAWVPPYVAVPVSAYEEWAENPKRWLAHIRSKQPVLRDALQLVSEDGNYPVIVRSSAVGEELEDRGRYLSLSLGAGAGLDELAAAIDNVFRDFDARAQHAAIGICLQRHVVSEFAGHASNEVRLSATRNQWKYGVEVPAFAPERGLNSKFAQPPDVQSPLKLTSQGGISAVLRGICNWVNLHFDRRSHMEWCAAKGRFWIVQLDQESPTSAGVNPHLMPDARVVDQSEPLPITSSVFTPHRIADSTPWRKLSNVRDFWTGVDPPPHRLFVATGEALAAALSAEGGAAALATEIDALTGGRAVLRTDCKDPKIKTFNMPRTHTVDGATAASWVAETLNDLRKKGAASADVAVILHRYIPARAAAWTYYSPGDEIVLIDCLWGLPDGLQFLSHDSIEIDARTGEELAAAIRFKPDFLMEQDDGTWRYVQVARQFARHRVLSRESLRTIALETVAIAQKINERTQVMWFCDLPPQLGLGQHLPWFRSKDFAEVEAPARPPLPTTRVRNLADLDALERTRERCIISITPDVELVRDDENFVDRVAAVAKARNLPVELAGSVLGHAYYRLRDSRVIVLVPHSKYFRVRGRRRHYKVVRDDIPNNIAAKGERVTVARLAQAEAAVALIGKLFEEGLELNGATAPAQVLEELADVLEVVRGLAVTAEVPWTDVIAAADEKRRKRGGFEQQTVLLETALPMPNRFSEASIVEDNSKPVIQLSDLGVVIVRGARASISFSKLLSHESIALELIVDGKPVTLTVALDDAGVSFVATERQRFDENPDIQLKMFEEDAAGTSA
jgi:predicted house-cleaning noncanonical NTP pyrophosphatase (MazG superfamily)